MQHGAGDQGEFDQHAVAGRLDDPPTMLSNKWIGGGTMFAQQTRCADSSASISQL
jgi:hypothetical protein